MFDTQTPPRPETPARSAREWLKILASYRDPSLSRSLFELAATLGPLFAIWSLAWAALSVSPWLALALGALNGVFLVRVFIIQHDCGHGAFLSNRKAQDWLGRTLGVLTLTPYHVWRRAHAFHHSHHGDLDARGIGDITTLTLDEYQGRSGLGRWAYRVYRHPVMLFVIGPSYMFFLQHRLPVGFMKAGRDFWISAMGTNLAILALWTAVYLLGGWQAVVLVLVPSVMVAASLGVWLFYVQHQFEDMHWSRNDDWQMHDAALSGSSHYVLPQPLQWLSGNIGIHHVHHLYSRIPFYRLPEVIRDHTALAEAQRLTIAQSIATVRLHLWDEQQEKLISFTQAHRQLAAA